MIPERPDLCSQRQPLANRTFYISERVPGAAGSYEIDLGIPALFSGSWIQVLDGGPGNDAWGLEQQTTGGAFSIPITMIPGDGAALIDYISVEMIPASGHAGTTITEPSMSLIKQPINGGTPTTVASVTFPNVVSLPAYEQQQTFVLPLNEVISNSHKYWFLFTGEAGAQFLAELLITKIVMAVNRS